MYKSLHLSEKFPSERMLSLGGRSLFSSPCTCSSVLVCKSHQWSCQCFHLIEKCCVTDISRCVINIGPDGDPLSVTGNQTETLLFTLTCFCFRSTFINQNSYQFLPLGPVALYSYLLIHLCRFIYLQWGTGEEECSPYTTKLEKTSVIMHSACSQRRVHNSR